MAEEVEAEIEEEEEECPKCPPVGAPAWMATFADMATLLMAFFVLILSFAEFNVPKFKQISGSLKNAFGVQRLVPVVEQPKGTTVLSLNFSPSPSPSVTKQMTQQTTNLEKKELEVKTEEDEGGEKDKSAKELVEALQEAVDKGEIKVEAIGEAVKVEIGDQDTAAKDLPKLIQETLEAIEEAKNKTGNTDQEVLFGGLEEKLKELASLAQTEADGDTKGSSKDSGSGVNDDNKSAKEASAAGAMFILLNSIAGIVPRIMIGEYEIIPITPLVVAVLIGGIAGSYMGSVRFDKRFIERTTGGILILAIFFLIYRIL